MSFQLFLYTTIWFLGGSLLVFLVIGIVEQEARWRQERHRRG